MNISEDELINAAKLFWKERGFKKVRKRWTKVVDDFTLSFLIQGSVYDKDFYYVRPGVFFNFLQQRPGHYYGHVYTGIEVNSIEQILQDTENYFKDWTDKELIKRRIMSFIEWDKRNPTEKRRVGRVNFKKDPAPADLFLLSLDELNFILKEL